MTTLLLASALFAGLLGLSAAAPAPPAPPSPPASLVPPAPAPFHAFCKTQWLFVTPCTEISATIVQQIQAFSLRTGCDVCRYELVSVSPRSVTANHTSTVDLPPEDLLFVFNPLMSGGCRVSAQSVSLGFTSRLDGRPNYCNLYNILSASGLSIAPGFMEITNEWACLEYGLTTCNE